MIDTAKKLKKRFQKAKLRSKKHIQPRADRPRLLVYRSNKYIYVQVLDSVTGKVVLSVSSVSKDMQGQKLGKSVASAKVLGAEVGRRLKDKKIQTVSFDRNGLKYHGRIKALADACRGEGIQF